MLGPTKAQLILYKLIPQIPLFWNYENLFIFYIKKRLKMGFLKIKFEIWEF